MFIPHGNSKANVGIACHKSLLPMGEGPQRKRICMLSWRCQSYGSSYLSMPPKGTLIGEHSLEGNWGSKTTTLAYLLS